MNNMRAWLVGRNLPAMHPAEINAPIVEALGRPDVDPSRISARASGVAGVALLLAAAVNDRIGSVTLERTPHSVRAAVDAPIHMDLHDAVIPGFAMKWDLFDMRDLIRPRSVVWMDPTDWSGNVVPLKGDFIYTPSDPNVPRWDLAGFVMNRGPEVLSDRILTEPPGHAVLRRLEIRPTTAASQARIFVGQGVLSSIATFVRTWRGSASDRREAPPR